MAKVFVTTTEAAEMLDVSAQTVRNWIAWGYLKAYRVNPSGKMLLKLEDLERSIEEGRLWKR